MKRLLRIVLSALVLIALGATAASAETLLMPPRDYAAAQSEIVWGITTQANGTAFSIDFGDSTPVVNGVITDRSYQAFNHTFPLSGTYTVTFTVGVEVATVVVKVYNVSGGAGSLTPTQIRDLNINRAIEDGLRYLWVNQSNRTTFDTNPQTLWTQYSYTALVVLAYMNHGHALPNSNAAPTGIYAKYAVQRGLNYVFANLSSFVAAANTPNGGNPCEGIGAGTVPCTLFTTGYPNGYTTSIVILPLAGSNALTRTSTVAGITSGLTYGDILRRLVNGLAWGQNDTGNTGGRGGWNYGFNDTISDGSTIGWNMLALLDATAAGVTPPAFVKPEFDTYAYTNAKNIRPGGTATDLAIDGTFDYNADGVPTSAVYSNTARVGIGLQAAFYVGDAVGDTYVNAAIAAADRRWDGVGESGDYTSTCAQGQNKGCAYAMFNLFKGLKLQGVSTLPSVNRPAGSIGDPDDWYADYVDWLINNQQSPQSTTGGLWQYNGGTNRFNAGALGMGWSCCDSNTYAISALAELILSPAALIQPDPGTFSNVGLQQGTPLSTGPDTNPVGTLHTVVAKVVSSGGANVPGVTISFQITGRNAAITLGSGVSDANGEVTKTYTDAGPQNTASDDNIQAFIGNVGSNLASNVLLKHWVLATAARCDADGSGRVDLADLKIISSANGQAASSSTDPRDGNGDGVINIVDTRYCQLVMAKQPPQ